MIPYNQCWTNVQRDKRLVAGAVDNG